jgi:hypothetical protein
MLEHQHALAAELRAGRGPGRTAARALAGRRDAAPARAGRLATQDLAAGEASPGERLPWS